MKNFKHSLTCASEAKYQLGVGLVEVMVALLLLAVGVLGFSLLQTKSIAATNLGLKYAEASNVMRDIAERIRANPSAISDYEEKLNASTLTKPEDKDNCGSFGTTSSGMCKPDVIAEADVYAIRQRLVALEMFMAMVDCPGTTGKMLTHCLVVSWDDTQPTLGAELTRSDGTLNCWDEEGDVYFRQAHCLMMEII